MALVVVLKEETSCARQTLVLQRCLRWFNARPHQVEQLAEILSHKGPTSLRLIDYYVTRFTKDNMVVIPGLNGAHDDYRRHLVSFSKKLFDPFARRHRISCLIGGENVITTAAQLNFMMWFLSNGLFDRLVESKKDVERHMRQISGSKKHVGKASDGHDPVSIIG